MNLNAYDFIALDSKGKRQKGTIMSSSPRDARNILRSRELVTVKITNSKPKDQSVSNFLKPRIKHKNLTQATRQLSILIDAATPVEEALKITADAEAYAVKVKAQADADQTKLLADAIAKNGQPAINFEIMKRTDK